MAKCRQLSRNAQYGFVPACMNALEDHGSVIVWFGLQASKACLQWPSALRLPVVAGAHLPCLMAAYYPGRLSHDVSMSGAKWYIDHPSPALSGPSIALGAAITMSGDAPPLRRFPRIVIDLRCMSFAQDVPSS